MNPHVRLFVGYLANWSVWHSFLKGRRSTCLFKETIHQIFKIKP